MRAIIPVPIPAATQDESIIPESEIERTFSVICQVAETQQVDEATRSGECCAVDVLVAPLC